jgi:hypothetical protein
MRAVVDGPCVRSPHPVRVDRRLYARLVDAFEEGLTKIESCPAAEYDGPWPEIVLRPDVDKLALGFDWSTQELVVNPEVPLGTRTLTRSNGLEYLAEYVVRKMERREQIAVQWLEIAWSVPGCPNDACAENFEPIVASDPTQVVWHIAASLHTWAHAGVWTPYRVNANRGLQVDCKVDCISAGRIRRNSR